jgi:hypothetical protein
VNGRSADQTFYADYWSKLGNGYGHELRYVLQSPSRGTFRTYVFDVKGASELDYDLDWNALQILPGKVKVALNVRQYSDLLFQQRYQDDFNAATSRTQRWQGSIEKDLKLAVLSATPTPPAPISAPTTRTSTAACPASRCGASRARSAGARWWWGSTPPPSGSSTGTRRTSTTGRASTWHPTSRGPSP